ncbi:lantibiotic dehydratase [Lentzea roselyniae]|uniref:lantibiotic dehydratase n=1 Tax=Lentzea roselyniae TaxID=531940 RepID=UPI0031F97691
MTDRVRGEPAPYALVRLAALPHPDGAAAAAPFRRAVEALADKESELLALAGPLSDLLHDSAGAHSAEFHRRVVLPLRRDVHNRRTPRPSVRAAAESLRIPLLDTWFRLMDECAELVLEVERHQPAALAAEREVLASLCAAEPLRKAAVLSGHDLWRGLGRTGSGDRRARKAEPAVLRYALRATSKTSPLSWYTSVGWGTWSPDAPAPDWGTPVAVTRVNQVLLTRLVAALVADRTRVFGHPHRLAPGVHEDGGRMTFLRDVPASGPLRAHVAAEENVELAVTAPLRFLVGLTAANPKGISPAELTSALATRLPDGESARAQRYIALLLDVKLLVPVLPVDPQDPEACRSLASWLRDTGRAALGDRVASIHRSTAAFGALPADSRPAALAALTAAWQELGELTGAELTGIVPLSEDVVLPQPVRLGRAYGYDGVRSLAALTPLLMLFDRHLAIRRYLRDQFVVEFGRGGSARLAACAPLLLDALASAPTGGLGASRAPGGRPGAGRRDHRRGRRSRRRPAALVDEDTPGLVLVLRPAVARRARGEPRLRRLRPLSQQVPGSPATGGLRVRPCHFGRCLPARFRRVPPGAGLQPEPAPVAEPRGDRRGPALGRPHSGRAGAVPRPGARRTPVAAPRLRCGRRRAVPGLPHADLVAGPGRRAARRPRVRRRRPVRAAVCRGLRGRALRRPPALPRRGAGPPFLGVLC